MLRRMRGGLLGGMLALVLWLGGASGASAQVPNLDKYYYYPFHMFPHNYWPQASATWPERPGQPYQPPPAYMAYPPFHEPYWRYEMNQRQSHYRGFHFWLDAF